MYELFKPHMLDEYPLNSHCKFILNSDMIYFQFDSYKINYYYFFSNKIDLKRFVICFNKILMFFFISKFTLSFT
jgi:hypothetical protein